MREVFESHEHLVAGAATGLLDGVKRRVRRRRTAKAAIGGVATLAVVVGVAVPLSLAARGGSPVVAGTPSGAVSTPTTGPAVPPPSGDPPSGPGPGEGWRWGSAFGVQIAVPVGWATNDFGCSMTDQSSFVNGGGSGLGCLTPEPETKQVAIVRLALNPPWPPGLAERPVTVDGVAGRRADGRTPDGRYAGWVLLPSREVRVEVRTRDAAVTKRILDSIRLVEVDHAGCPARRPAAAPASFPGPGLVPADPQWIGICDYNWDGRLTGSARLAGAEAATLAEAINARPPGRNPDAPANTCLPGYSEPPEVVLRVRDGSGSTWVWVSFGGCTGRGLDNGSRQVQIGRSLLHRIMAPLHTSYGFSGDLRD